MQVEPSYSSGEDAAARGSRRAERATQSVKALTSLFTGGFTSSAVSSTVTVIGDRAECTSRRVQQCASSIPDAALDLMSFVGHEHLLRGSSLSTMLHRCASVFQSSAGSAKTYALSKQVGKIDAFISHNWCVSRYQKYIALALHFNFSIAAWTTALVMAVITVVGAAGAPLPDWSSPSDKYPRGICCQLTCVPVFLLSLLLCREIGHFVGLEGPMLFLDKTCIHQENADLQRQGISKLGAFILSSRQMVVVYSDFYLQRLWTVYEVASFLTLHPVCRMKILPLANSVVFLGGLVGFYLAGVFAIVLAGIFGSNLSLYFTSILLALLVLLGYGLVRGVRQYVKERASMRARLAHFTVRECRCAVEDDRPVVYDRIASLMRVSQLAQADASDDDALTVFDCLVRTVLPEAMADSMGRSTMKIKHCMALCALVLLPYFLDNQVGWAHGMTVRYFITDLMFYLTVCFAIGPVVLAFLAMLAQLRMHLSGWWEEAYLVVIWLCAGAAALVPFATIYALSVWGEGEDAGIVAEAACSLLMFAILYVVYRPRRREASSRPSLLLDVMGPDRRNGHTIAWIASNTSREPEELT